MPETKTSPVRHAVVRSTGATTLARKEGDEWKIDCLNHGASATAPSRGAAWKVASHPQDFCPKCKTIAAGKAEKITEGRLDLPTAKKPATKKTTAAKKPAAKPTPKKTT